MLDQRRLAGAIFADQPDDRASADLEVNLAERSLCAELSREVLDFHDPSRIELAICLAHRNQPICTDHKPTCLNYVCGCIALSRVRMCAITSSSEISICRASTKSASTRCVTTFNRLRRSNRGAALETYVPLVRRFTTMPASSISRYA